MKNGLTDTTAGCGFQWNDERDRAATTKGYLARYPASLSLAQPW